MAIVIEGPVTGQVVKDGKVIREDRVMWCLKCLQKRVKNHQRLTKDDKKYVDSVEMKDWVTTDRDGGEARGKSCPKCRQTIVLTENGVWKEPKQA